MLGSVQQLLILVTRVKYLNVEMWNGENMEMWGYYLNSLSQVN